jgi:hypothetical protein
MDAVGRIELKVFPSALFLVYDFVDVRRAKALAGISKLLPTALMTDIEIGNQ